MPPLMMLLGLLAISVAATVTKDIHSRAKVKIIEHHSMHPPHLRDYWGEGIPFWSFQGSTVVTDDYIRLTPDRQSQVGMVWNTEPLDLPAWEIHLGFRVHSKSGYGADGMALWIVDDIPTSDGPLFGHPKDFVGVGIVFDSYDNDRYRDNPAVHIIVNPKGEKREFNAQQDFRGQSAANCYYDFRNVAKPHHVIARIRYDGNTVQVFLTKTDEKEEVLCGSVSGVTLSEEPSSYFIGMTAETGGISDSHDIHYLHVTPLEGYHYDHDVFEHQPFNHHNEKDQKHYWRAKTPEELAQEEQEKERRRQEEVARLNEESERIRREAEQHNNEEAGRREHDAQRKSEAPQKEAAEQERVKKLEEEMEGLRRKLAEQDKTHEKLRKQREAHRAEIQQKARGAVPNREEPPMEHPAVVREAPEEVDEQAEDEASGNQPNDVNGEDANGADEESPQEVEEEQVPPPPPPPPPPVPPRGRPPRAQPKKAAPRRGA
jgi:mannose-binding lectin 1